MTPRQLHSLFPKYRVCPQDVDTDPGSRTSTLTQTEAPYEFLTEARERGHDTQLSLYPGQH